MKILPLTQLPEVVEFERLLRKPNSDATGFAGFFIPACSPEKPAVDVARAHLRVDGLDDDEFLGWFGMHILTPSIYDVLAEMIRDDVRDGGEFQLTRAQEIQREREGYTALEIRDGRRCDFGVPTDFVRSQVGFARPGI